MADLKAGQVADLQFIAEASEQIQSLYDAYQAGTVSPSSGLTMALTQMKEQLLAIPLSGEDGGSSPRNTACQRISDLLEGFSRQEPATTGDSAPTGDRASEANTPSAAPTETTTPHAVTPMAPAFCHNCGTPAAGRFCHGCGSALTSDVPIPSSPAAFPPPTHEQLSAIPSGTPTSSRMRLLAVVTAATLVLAGGGAGTWWYLSQGHSPTRGLSAKANPSQSPSPEFNAQENLRNALTAEQTYWTSNQSFSDNPTDMSQLEPSIQWTNGRSVPPGNNVMVTTGSSQSAVLLTAAGANGHCYSIMQINVDSGSTYYHDGGPHSVAQGVCSIPAPPSSLPADGSLASETPDGWGTSF